MTHYFCIATGTADFSPTSQDYHTVETESEFREIVKSACDEWASEYAERPTDETRGDEYYRHEFRMPRAGEDNYSQRLMIGASDDWVLDVIGMTAEEFERESGE